jgi:hypothetical protein
MLKPFLETFFALVWTFNDSTETTELAETPLPENVNGPTYNSNDYIRD